MKIQLILIITLILSGCGGIKSPEIPLTEKEITFFDQLNHHPLAIDSVNREIKIGVFLWRKFAKDIIINIYSYSTKDSLTVKEWNSLSAEIASFYSTQEIEGIKFTSCSVRYMHSVPQDGCDYFYRYDIDNNAIILKSRSYELEKEEKQESDSLKYSTD